MNRSELHPVEKGEPTFIEDPSWSSFITLPSEMEDFTLCNLLGSGSTGQVYRALQTKEFAIKVIPWHPEYHREMAKHEYELSQLFNTCDEILHSIDYYEANQQSFIVMEYGVPCISYFSGRTNRMRDVLTVILRIANALEEIHAHGYTHFDVKPDNIMMIKGKAKLADFSHCAAYITDQHYDRLVGTGVYMAPEIRIGGKHTGKEDMYSFGITMYALLMAGRVPFDFSGKQTPCRGQGDEIDSLFIHPELISIICKAAAYEANNRYSSFSELSNDIASFMKKHKNRMDEEIPSYYMLPALQTTIPSYSFWTPSREDLFDVHDLNSKKPVSSNDTTSELNEVRKEQPKGQHL